VREDLADLDATAQAALVRRGDVTPLELVDAAIARIERLNPRLNAVIHEHFERARCEARSTLPDGPFRGVPFLLKDLAGGAAAGDPYTWGTRFLRDADYRHPTSSYIVDKFRQAGLVIVGRSNVPELGAWATTESDAYGPCRNPWNPEHASGGSSGGAAAAVASGMVPVAHASDGGGSIRNPASQCGIIGLKPTRGRISLGPDIAEGWAGMAFEFAVTRSVCDTAALLDAVEGAMPGDPYDTARPLRPYVEEVGAAPGRLRIGLLGNRLGGEVHPDCVAALDAAGRRLVALGHDVEESYPPALVDRNDLLPNGITIVAASQAHLIDVFGRMLGRRLGPDDMDHDNWAITELGQSVSTIAYLDALQAMNGFRRRVAAWWADGYDLLVTPTLTGPPPRLGEHRPVPGQPLVAWTRTAELLRFTIPFNVTGQPAISLPLHWSEEGLPIGVQLVAAFGREDLLLRVAAQLEADGAWRNRRPPIHA
jgi:amidase